MRTPFFSIARTYQDNQPLFERRIKELLCGNAFSEGSAVRAFEAQIEEYCHVPHAIAVGNATDALVLMLKGAGVEPGDEVIVPAYSFMASASSIALVGARPVFVDIEPHTFALNPKQVRDRITSRTKAIMPVHLFTQMANMQAIAEIASEFGVRVLEDSAEGIGMWQGGQHAGCIGDAGVLSFFPTKTLGALGDAGMILTADEALAAKYRELRDCTIRGAEGLLTGRFGIESRMDDLQAAFLSARLELLAHEIQRRARCAAIYDQLLEDLYPLVKVPVLSQVSAQDRGVFYVYLIEADDRDALIRHLQDRQVGTEVYYPIPLPFQPCFAGLAHQRGEFPIAERASSFSLALPLYPDLENAQIEYVSRSIHDFYKGRL